MMTKTQADTIYASPEERLSELPPAWRYAVGSAEEKQIFHRVVCELLAEELCGDGTATLRVNNLVAAFAAHRCLTWIDDVRAILRRVPGAEEVLAKTTEAKLESAKDKAETAHAKAAEELEAAKRALIVAETKLRTATNDLDQYRDAEKLLSDPVPGQAKNAIEHLKRLQADG